MTSLAVRILLSVHSRTVRDNLADRPPLNLYTAARLALPLLNSAQPLADRPRSFGGPSAVYFCGWELLCRASGEQVPWTADCPPLTRGPSALLKIWQVWILPIFSIPTLILDHCSYKNPKNLKYCMKTFQRLIWTSYNKNSKNKLSGIMKTHK